ncbi:hypothetical protein J7643_03045 [bacterium]|nr:hypothetical protein [bacterium]
MRACLAALVLTLGMASSASALPSRAQVIALALTPKEQAKPLQEALEKELKSSRRFVVAKPVTFQGSDANPQGAISGLRRATKADLVFGGSVVEGKDGELELNGRIYDLAVGDASKAIRFTGVRNDTPALARELARYMRAQAPLRGEITGMRDNRVLLNIGYEDGVQPGSYFAINRAGAARGAQAGQLRIISADAWFSTGELLSRSRGQKVSPGDAVVEDVDYGLIAP